MKILANMLAALGIIIILFTIAIKLLGLAPLNLIIINISASTSLLFANTILIIATYIKASSK